MNGWLGTDGLPWTCLEYIKLNETDTTSSSRIFIKVLAQELSESLGKIWRYKKRKRKRYWLTDLGNLYVPTFSHSCISLTCLPTSLSTRASVILSVLFFPFHIFLFWLSGLAKLRDRFSDPYMQDVFSGLFPRDNARDTRFAINFFTSIGLGGLTDGLRGKLKVHCNLLLLTHTSFIMIRKEHHDFVGCVRRWYIHQEGCGQILTASQWIRYLSLSLFFSLQFFSPSLSYSVIFLSLYLSLVISSPFPHLFIPLPLLHYSLLYQNIWRMPPRFLHNKCRHSSSNSRW